MTFTIKFQRGLSAWLSDWIMGLFITVTLDFEGGVGAVGAGAVQRMNPGALDREYPSRQDDWTAFVTIPQKNGTWPCLDLIYCMT